MEKIFHINDRDCECNKDFGYLKASLNDRVLDLELTASVKTLKRMSTKCDKSIVNDTIFTVHLNGYNFCFSANLNMAIFDGKGEIVFSDLYEKIERSVKIIENNNKRSVFKLSTKINLDDFSLDDNLEGTFSIFSNNQLTIAFREKTKLF